METGETFSPRWTYSIIEPLRAGTIFDWGIDEEAGMWAAYRSTTGWIAKVSIDDGKNWNIKKTAIVGNPIDAITAQRLTGCDDGMREHYD